jgi:MFS family permease
VIIFGLTVVEIFWSMSNVGWSALISDIFPLASRSAVMARLESVGGVGRMIGIWIGGLLYDGMGRRYEGWGFEHGALFWVASAVMLVSIGPLMAVPEGGVAAGDPVRPKASGSGSGASTTLLLGLFLMAMVCINFGRNAIAITLPQYLMLDQGLAVSSALLGHIMNTHSLAIILCGLVAARISRRIGDRRLLVAGTLAAIAALVGYSLWVNLAVVFIASFVRGLSEVVIMASAYGLASGLIPAHMRARVFGIFNATFFLGWGVGATLMAGPIIDILLARGWAEVSAYRAAFASAAALTTVGVVLLVLLFKLALKR